MVTDGTKEKEDVKTSQSPKGTSVETFTAEQVAERERRARSDTLADVGRYKAESEKSSKAAQKALERLEQMEKERAEAELEAHRDDPEGIRRIRAEQGRKKAEDERESTAKELSEAREKLEKFEAKEAESTRTQAAREIAERLGVDAEKLIKLSAKLTDVSIIEEIAEDLPKVYPAKPGLKPDSNRSLGGVMSWDDVQKKYAENPYDPEIKARFLEMRVKKF